MANERDKDMDERQGSRGEASDEGELRCGKLVVQG
jgi:hypothetical protein